jgi:hypothetical protein
MHVANFGEVRPMRKIGSAAVQTFEVSSFSCAQFIDVKVWLDVELTGNSTLDGIKFDERVVKIDVNKRQANRRRISVDSIIYNCMESLSEQSGAERRHLIKCKLVRPEVLSKKKKKKRLGSGCREISLEECDERR